MLREVVDRRSRTCASTRSTASSSTTASKIGARVIVRGLRAATDFEYELQIAHANADLAPEIDTIFLPTRTNYGFVSASLVREIASHGGDVSHYAPAPVCEALKLKFAKTLARASIDRPRRRHEEQRRRARARATAIAFRPRVSSPGSVGG